MGGQYTYISDGNFVKFIAYEEECEKQFFLKRLGKFYTEADWERTAEPLAPRMDKEFRDSKNRIQEALVADTAAEEFNRELADES